MQGAGPLSCLICTLHEWQELTGAILGGLLGVIGALIVARSALNRERRNASRMLQRDLLNVTAMVRELTYHRKVTLASVGADTLATNLAFYRHHLSALFESQMAILIGADTHLAGLLIGFHKAYTAVEGHMRQIERAWQTAFNASADRDREALPRRLQYADDYAQAALYLLPLQEWGAFHRLCGRLHRRFFPTQEDTAAQKLVQRMSGAQMTQEDTQADNAG